jgi:seryl-tRNA synthetase
MLDIKFIRENKDLIALAAQKKLIKFDVEELLAADTKRRELMQSMEAKKAEQNSFNEKIAMSATSSPARTELIAKMKVIKDEFQKQEEVLKEVMKTWQLLMLQVPNVPDISVPDGVSDADNKEVRVWGKIPTFDFEPKDHVTLMENLDMADLERGVKVAGFRGYFLKNDGVLLNFALWRFVMDHFLGKGGFTPIMTPTLVKRDSFMGTGYLPQSEEDLYKTQDDLYLTGTAEVPTMGYHMDEILDIKDLPKKFLAFSPCYRREAGSHGKDTRGIMRVHEFFKFEQVILCEASHEESVKNHEDLTKNAEELLQKLGIPHHVVVNCGGDLGLGQVKKYDIESWVPSEKKYRETHSSSYFHDFQTRRLNIRYRNAQGKLQFVHSLNNTAAATPRLFISLIENNQQKDGSINIPEVLRPYMGKDVIRKS